MAKNQEEYDNIMKRNNRYNIPVYKIVNKDDHINLYYVFNLDIYNQKE